MCMVAPPGAGKTEMAMEVIRRFIRGRVLWVVPRRDLARQARKRLSDYFGRENVGTLFRGVGENSNARIVIATVQSLLKLHRPLSGFEGAYLDECHHYVADEWRKVELVQRGGFPRIFGGTATPERADGKPLGDLFDSLVSKVSYSQLIKDGYLVAPNISRPSEDLEGAYAANPIDVWFRYGGRPAILWVPSIRLSDHYALEATNRGYIARSITETSDMVTRTDALQGFARRYSLLTNVSTLLEGIDLPACQIGILGRRFTTVASYLQATGRLLRPFPGRDPNWIKLLIDLTGCTHTHGLPYTDRVYSLTGTAISSSSSSSRESTIGERSDPEVFNLPLSDDFVGDRPPAIPMPTPNPERTRRWEEVSEQYRRSVAKYGEGVADQTWGYQLRELELSMHLPGGCNL